MANRVYGIYMATPPTLSDGEIHPILLDSGGKVIVESNADASPTVKAPLQVSKALAGSPAPIAIVASETFATAVYLQAARANGDNTDDVFIGLADVVSGTDNYVKLTPGATWEYKCRPGTKVDLQVFLIDGETATDGVQGYYEPV